MIAASPASSEPAPLTVRMFDVDGDRFYFVSDGEESNCGEDHIGALFRADRGESPRELELVLASPDLAGDAVTLVRDRVSSEIRILYRDWQMRLPRGKEADTRTTTRVPFEGCGC